MNKQNTILNITLSGMFIALGIIFPFMTGQIPEIGSMLCPMHIPVLICGFICGWRYGLIVGYITPLLRSLLFSLPPLYPTSILMAFELATYGLISGLLYNYFKDKKKNNLLTNFIVLVFSMIIGRLVWGIASYTLTIIDKTFAFNIEIFINGAFIMAWPGIILQLIIIPTLITSLKKTNILK